MNLMNHIERIDTLRSLKLSRHKGHIDAATVSY